MFDTPDVEWAFALDPAHNVPSHVAWEARTVPMSRLSRRAEIRPEMLRDETRWEWTWHRKAPQERPSRRRIRLRDSSATAVSATAED
jgi:hypothetical protein